MRGYKREQNEERRRGEEVIKNKSTREDEAMKVRAWEEKIWETERGRGGVTDDTNKTHCWYVCQKWWSGCDRRQRKNMLFIRSLQSASSKPHMKIRNNDNNGNVLQKAKPIQWQQTRCKYTQTMQNQKMHQKNAAPAHIELFHLALPLEALSCRRVVWIFLMHRSCIFAAVCHCIDLDFHGSVSPNGKVWVGRSSSASVRKRKRWLQWRQLFGCQSGYCSLDSLWQASITSWTHTATEQMLKITLWCLITFLLQLFVCGLISQPSANKTNFCRWQKISLNVFWGFGFHLNPPPGNKCNKWI